MKKGVKKFGGRGRKAVFLQPFRSKTEGRRSGEAAERAEVLKERRSR